MSSSNPFNLPRTHIRAQSDKIIQSQQLNSARTVASCVDTTNKLMRVDIVGGTGSHGLATEAKQDAGITKLTEIDNAIDSVDGKITAGSDDSITGDLQQNLVYGRYDFNGDLKALKCSSDGSVITAPAGGTIVTTDGTTSEQRVMMLAHSGGNLRTVLCDGNGALIVDPSEDSIITADGVTQEQRVMIQGAHNGNLRTIACGNGGQLQTEVDHSWDNTNTLIDNVSVGASATITSSSFDLSQGVSHEIGNIEFYLTNSALLDTEVSPEVSPDGTNWYGIVNSPTVNTSNEFTSFSQEEIAVSRGHRWMRFQVTNNGSKANPITLIAAYYK